VAATMLARPEFTHCRSTAKSDNFDPRFPAGVEAVFVRMKNRAGQLLLGFIVAGVSGFSAHPVDLFTFDGRRIPLSTTRGLIPSFDPHFDWQIDTDLLVTKSTAGRALIAWCDTYL
jgi:hypothetical protein